MGGVSDGGVRRSLNSCMQVVEHFRVRGVSISTVSQQGPWRLMDIIRWGHGDIISLVQGCSSGVSDG